MARILPGDTVPAKKKRPKPSAKKNSGREYGALPAASQPNIQSTRKRSTPSAKRNKGVASQPGVTRPERKVPVFARQAKQGDWSKYTKRTKRSFQEELSGKDATRLERFAYKERPNPAGKKLQRKAERIDMRLSKKLLTPQGRPKKRTK